MSDLSPTPSATPPAGSRNPTERESLFALFSARRFLLFPRREREEPVVKTGKIPENFSLFF